MTSLADRAYAGIKEEILACAMAPGSLINEAELARTYGTSKTPVRQAIGRLAAEGFVEVFPRRGCLVRTVQVRDIKNVYLLRTLVEPEASALAARSASAADLAALQELDDRIGEGGDEQLDLRAHAAFHVGVCRIARVPQLTAIVSSLQDQMRWFLAAQHADGGPMPPKANHRRLLEALRAHDAEQARAITEESIVVSRSRLLQRIVQTGGEPVPEGAPA